MKVSYFFSILEKMTDMIATIASIESIMEFKIAAPIACI
jgi:hypothetical protein